MGEMLKHLQNTFLKKINNTNHQILLKNMEAVATEKKAVQVTPAKSRKIKTVAVLGSGVMGSRIALHYANVGLKVFLLDIVTPKLSEEDAKKPALRNKLVNDALTFAL